MSETATGDRRIWSSTPVMCRCGEELTQTIEGPFDF